MGCLCAWTTVTVGVANEREEASNFYIQLDNSDKQGKWFYIVTDPAEQLEFSGETTSESKPAIDDITRFVHIGGPNGGPPGYQFTLEAYSTIDHRKASFKLVSRDRKMSVPVI